MTGFLALERRMGRDMEELHDYLWSPTWKGDPEALRRRLLRDARELDTFLRAGGRLRRNAEALATPWSKDRMDDSLFELLDHAFNLTAATQRVQSKDFDGAVRHATSVAQSASIGLCASAGRFEIVQEWQSGKTDFDTYTQRVADFLQEKGVPQAGQFRRLLNAVYAFAKAEEPGAWKPVRAQAARTAVEATAWCVLAEVSIRTALGVPPKFPADDFGDVVARIVARL